MAEIKPRLEKLFKDWKPGAVPAKDVAPVALRGPARRLHHGQAAGAPVGGHLRPPGAAVGRPRSHRH
ncbi:MAG: hypothetical protein M0C28_00915 [Candidatus Moduliflexus flocculans]|nr:hypothetical protein [Candidatus Moduliflexus flocculans]